MPTSNIWHREREKYFSGNDVVVGNNNNNNNNNDDDDDENEKERAEVTFVYLVLLLLPRREKPMNWRDQHPESPSHYGSK